MPNKRNILKCFHLQVTKFVVNMMSKFTLYAHTHITPTDSWCCLDLIRDCRENLLLENLGADFVISRITVSDEYL